MARKSARAAARAAPSAWGSPLAGGEYTDIFERILAAVKAAPDARASLAAMRLVSREWCSVVDDSIAELEPASPVCEPQLSQLLRRFRNVREVNPDENVRMPLRVTDDTLPALLGLRRLRALGLNFGVSPEGVRRLASLGPTLTALSYAGDMTRTRSRSDDPQIALTALSYSGDMTQTRPRRSTMGAGLTDNAARAIGATLTNLQRLSISRSAELGVGVSAFSSLQQLQQLRLYELGGVDDFSLVPAVSGLTRLTALTVAMCGIGDGSMAAIAALARLQVLDLSQNAELSDDGVARLSTLGALTSLNLSGASQVTLRTLPQLPALVHLEVASTETDDAGLLTLEHQSNLQRLSLADCQSLSGAGLYALRCISGLASLNLSSCLELGDNDPLAVMQFLTGLTSLKIAFLEDLKDEDITNLKPLSRLQVLVVNVQDGVQGLAELEPEGLGTLKTLTALCHLALPDLPLSAESAEELRASLPSLVEFQYEQAGTMQRLLDEMYAAPEEDE